MNRRKSREKAVQILFSMDMTEATAQEALENLMEEDDEEVREQAAENMEFLTELVEGTSAHRAEIDSKISQYLRGWTIARIANVDRAILRLAGYEMMYRNDIPVRVTLNEAVELAKMFGTDESPKFINGVLSSLSRELEQAEHKE